MAELASELVGALGGEQRALAHQPFADDRARRDWHYVPRRRPGLAFTDMDAVAQKAAYRLLASALSISGYARATTIIALEDVLDELEGGAGARRHRPERWGRHRADYATSVFGEPGDDAPWGWRFEGHHLSVNVTVVDGAVSSTPLFFGANPAEVVDASGPVLQPLASEGELAVAMIDSLVPAQRTRARVYEIAPDDILSANAPRLGPELEPAGLPRGRMTGASAKLFDALVDLYLDRLTEPVATAMRGRLASTRSDVHLAWGGATGPGAPFYYRLQGTSILIEYDNTQDGANHVHTVLRDPGGDFGEDLLRAHLAASHGTPPA